MLIRSNLSYMVIYKINLAISYFLGYQMKHIVLYDLLHLTLAPKQAVLSQTLQEIA